MIDRSQSTVGQCAAGSRTLVKLRLLALKALCVFKYRDKNAFSRFRSFAKIDHYDLLLEFK